MFQTTDIIKTLNLIYYLFDENTKNGRYYDVVNELVKRLIRVGIPKSKERYKMVLDFVQKMTLESPDNVLEVIKVYLFVMKYNHFFSGY